MAATRWVRHSRPWQAARPVSDPLLVQSRCSDNIRDAFVGCIFFLKKVHSTGGVVATPAQWPFILSQRETQPGRGRALRVARCDHGKR